MTTNPPIKVGQVWINRIKQRVRIFATDMKDSYFTVVGAIELIDGSETLETFSAEGKYNREGSPSDYDLVRLAPEAIEIKNWFNVIRVAPNAPIPDFYHTQKEAQNARYSIGVIVIERAVPFVWKGEMPEEPAPSEKPAEEHAPNIAW